MDLALKMKIEQQLAIVLQGEEGLGKSLSLLDEIARDSTLGLPGELKHYLEKRSYQKASNYLKAEPENG